MSGLLDLVRSLNLRIKIFQSLARSLTPTITTPPTQSVNYNMSQTLAQLCAAQEAAKCEAAELEVRIAMAEWEEKEAKE